MTRYELLDRIGVGGMAEIFRGKAVAAGGFEKPVAIKRILPHLSQDTRFVELLIAEAKVLSLLKHRNIVQIFDVGLGDDGQYFLVMEYVDGKDLNAIWRGLEARRKRMPFDLCLHIGAEICEALEHAHTARAPDGKPMLLVHRDVSPSNVLLSRAGECKLTDFGIAKRAEQEQTGHGAVRGKFAYISPEQARNEHIDPRSDVFSVGILLWELVTNRRLFSGLGDLEALRAVREAQVPKPSDADPRLDKQVDALLLSALARNLKDRPSAGQFGAQLRSLRYSLESTVGDPATELAKIIDAADEVARESQQMVVADVRSSRQFGAQFADSEHTEATVIRIRTADEFTMRDKDGTGMARIRQVIDHFEEEQTRQATLSGDQLRFLRSQARHDTGEQQAIPPSRGGLPGVAAAPRSRRTTDEPTRAHAPLYTDDAPTVAQMGSAADFLDGLDMDSGPRPARRIDETPPNSMLPADEHTRLVARSRDAISRRTPVPGLATVRPPTQPPPIPSGSSARMPAQAPPPPPPRSLPSPTNPPAMVGTSGSGALPKHMLPMGPAPSSNGPGMSGIQPGMSGNAGMQSGIQPGMSGNAAGMSGNAGMQSGIQPGMSGMPPGPSSNRPGMFGNPPGMSGNPPGMSGMPPGMSGNAPGMSGNAPGMSGMQPGMSGNAPNMSGAGYPGMNPMGGNPNMPPGNPNPNPYPQWGPGTRPSANGLQMFAPPPNAPQVSGFQQQPKKGGLQPWMLVVGAIVMAALAFAITRAFLS